MSKYYTDKRGYRGFVYSPRYGTGWYTENGKKYPDCATDPDLVALVQEYWEARSNPNLTYAERNERGRLDRDVGILLASIERYARYKWPDGLWDGNGLCVEWVPGRCIVTFEAESGSEIIEVKPVENDGTTLHMMF